MSGVRAAGAVGGGVGDTAADGGWAGLFRAEPSACVAGAWLRGLGFNTGAPEAVLLSLLDTGTSAFLLRTNLPAGVLDAAVDHPLRRVWGMAADSGRLSDAQWERLLAARPPGALRETLAEVAADLRADRLWRARVGVGIERPPSAGSRPPATPEEIAAMAEAVPAIEPGHRTYALWWVAALHEDPDAMRQLASSPKLWVRRSVARARRLPPDVLERLARDEDRAVRLFLSESCEDAPAEVLLDVWCWWSGSFSFPGRPRNHPNFPRHDLLRFADAPEPRLRLLALDDPSSTAALAERFCRDPDREVRARAAKDPRLSPETVAGLLDDADASVRALARRHPALPTACLVPLLLDERTAEEAAGNPAVPEAVMHRMVAVAAAVRAGAAAAKAPAPAVVPGVP
ncbi:hypothetical protein [Kitasatospora sp. NPDC048538]|uniref:hypothetical protein n=1 Tax=unclassified Kitasatospora TaxID=2633591 RepID=UPI0033C91954